MKKERRINTVKENWLIGVVRHCLRRRPKKNVYKERRKQQVYLSVNEATLKEVSSRGI